MNCYIFNKNIINNTMVTPNVTIVYKDKFSINTNKVIIKLSFNTNWWYTPSLEKSRQKIKRCGKQLVTIVLSDLRICWCLGLLVLQFWCYNSANCCTIFLCSGLLWATRNVLLCKLSVSLEPAVPTSTWKWKNLKLERAVVIQARRLCWYTS